MPATPTPLLVLVPDTHDPVVEHVTALFTAGNVVATNDWRVAAANAPVLTAKIAKPEATVAVPFSVDFGREMDLLITTTGMRRSEEIISAAREEHHMHWSHLDDLPRRRPLAGSVRCGSQLDNPAPVLDHDAAARAFLERYTREIRAASA